MTDPSYYNQLVVFSNLNIGNTGFNMEDIESYRFWLSGIIVKNFSVFYSNFKSKNSIYNYLKINKILILEVSDTRSLIKIIRSNNYNYSILFFKNKKIKNKIKEKYIKYVSSKINFSFNQNIFLKNKFKYSNLFFFKVLVIDLGLKLNILRSLIEKKCYLIVVNYCISLRNIMKINPDGIVLTNGPGNPKYYNKLLKKIKFFFKKHIPILGICFGHQIISLSLGMKINKMKIGHHGSNHPVKVSDRKIFISSQNHNYFSNNIKCNFFSLFDFTNQGFYIRKKKIISFQGHPEAAPGTNDFKFIFSKFINFLIK